VSDADRSAPASNRSIPDSAIIPVLGYADVGEAVAWLASAFGFRERLRIADHRAQLVIGGGAVVVTDGGAPAGGSTDSVMVRITDLDRHCLRAAGAGAVILNPPATYPFGERQYTARDPWGHVWTFTETVADVDPRDWGGRLYETPG
jgi:uncharacterized glyoxalase superfamily protein PhnB